ncbi:MAG: ATP-binding protein [Moraxella sp.]|uniref:ATP-binding protein n=1 Tax=Moraxella sp. TaxID=479 RepID=UPI0026DCC40A|nr:ATP-binding protein [Moraxella sp.]MDO4449999.1 ATP-binding protein [Moraxella sp.]
MTDILTHRLPYTALTCHTDPATLPKTTAHAPTFNPNFGQDRAVKAIQTALDIKANGYHIFAVGENGLGKRTLITRLLAERAKTEPTPQDIVFVHNFDDPRLPIAISLPTGIGLGFRQEMDKLWKTCQKKLTTKFTSLNYQNQLANLKSHLQVNEKKLISEFNELAKPFNVFLSSVMIDEQKIPSFSPIDVNKPIDDSIHEKLHKKLINLNFALDELENNTNAKIDELHENLAIKLLTPLFELLIKKYQSLNHDKNEVGKLITHLKNLLSDMVANTLDIVDGEGDFNTPHIPARYGVNVVVSHQKNSGAPIVFEELPTHLNLLGHIEYTTELGTAYSDVSMIRSGALMRANGGYLILEALSLLEHPYAWQGLKRALQSKQIKLSSLEQMLTLTGSLSLEPMSIPLSVKVILLGEPDLYYELLEFEPEFNSVFKIRADFNDVAPRNLDNELQIVAKINNIVKKNDLLVFDNTACAKIMDILAMFCDEQNKLDLHSDRLSQLIFESHRNAILDNKKSVRKIHIETTLKDMQERTGYLKELYWQELKNGQQLISTTGQKVGQINALTVISYADSEFGLPARLTATIAPKFGNGEILDIERDVELGGSLHAKGMLIMTSFLRAEFSQFGQMNFSASLAFEQSYGQIDGDSATMAECCALLSALANVPINQSLAITGSMNQLGEAQAIGGLNAKIAGFFDICKEQGLTGNQGVIMPKANLHNLMLKDEIIDAVKNGQFHIYAVETIYEALALLTGISVNDKNKKGEFKKGSLFYKVIKRLNEWEKNDE